jgi:hypothetical protein
MLRGRTSAIPGRWVQYYQTNPMQLDSIKSTLYRLEELMYGYNFEVNFGIECFENCNSIDDFKIKLRKAFPETRPEEAPFFEVDSASFWQNLNECLTYRGDKSEDYYLGDENKLQIELEQNKYTDFLKKFLSNNSKIYEYADERGIPGYPVWWDFRYFIFGENDLCIFIYGSASD